MRVVWKFPLGVIPGVTTLHLPIGAVTLSVGAQGQDVVLWVYVDPDPDRPTETRTFVTVGVDALEPVVREAWLGKVDAEHTSGLPARLFELLRDVVHLVGRRGWCERLAHPSFTSSRHVLQTHRPAAS